MICFTLGFGTPETKEEMRESNYWKFMFCIPGVVAIAQTVLLLLFFKHETPIYSLIMANDESAARSVLCKIAKDH